MNTDLKKKNKKLMNNVVFGKTMENVRKKKKLLNLSQPKKEETIWCQNQIIILQNLSQNIY